MKMSRFDNRPIFSFQYITVSGHNSHFLMPYNGMVAVKGLVISIIPFSPFLFAPTFTDFQSQYSIVLIGLIHVYMLKIFK